MTVRFKKLQLRLAYYKVMNEFSIKKRNIIKFEYRVMRVISARKYIKMQIMKRYTFFILI